MMTKHPSVLFMAVSLLCLSAGSLAASTSNDKQPPDLATIKQRLLQQHDQHIQILETSRNCIQAADNLEAIKSCMQTQRQQLEALRPQHGRGQAGQP